MTNGPTRKSQHLEIVLGEDVSAQSTPTGFEQVRFEHVALPELALPDIDLSTTFLNRRLAAPLLISSMTGGPEQADGINRAIAESAQHLKIAFGIGSQRVALDGEATAGLGRHLRDLAPDVPILANFGAAQLAAWNGPDMARRAMDMVGADALIIHLNPLQEAVQPEGDRDWRGLLAKIEALQRALPAPIIVKEVGAGISGRLARQLWDIGIRIIDVAGTGGTSWAAVEARRAPNAHARAVAEAFRDWGIPTARALQDVRAACPSATVIASGGIRDGLDAAKAVRLGADLTGMAAGVLAAALDGTEALNAQMSLVIEQLRIACFCTGSSDLAALRRAPLLSS
ncbi:MAG: type 2 isopentenyl-diphosphate Delta-isomerase [Hyphomicrobiaceae bacterium]